MTKGYECKTVLPHILEFTQLLTCLVPGENGLSYPARRHLSRCSANASPLKSNLALHFHFSLCDRIRARNDENLPDGLSFYNSIILRMAGFPPITHGLSSEFITRKQILGSSAALKLKTRQRHFPLFISSKEKKTGRETGSFFILNIWISLSKVEPNTGMVEVLYAWLSCSSVSAREKEDG